MTNTQSKSQFKTKFLEIKYKTKTKFEKILKAIFKCFYIY